MPVAELGRTPADRVRPRLELVCAHVAEVLSLEDAAALVCARAGSWRSLRPRAAKWRRLAASAEETLAVLAELSETLSARLEIAGVNTPKQTVISGDPDAVEVLVRRFEAKGHKSARLRVSHAFHSAHMDGMLDAFREVADRLTYHAPTLTVISNVTGQVADVARGELATADYWERHVRRPVRFADGVRSAMQAGATAFLECGPHGVLCAMAAECVALAEDTNEGLDRITMVPSLREDQEEQKTILAALGALYVHGRSIDWASIAEATGQVDLPTYAFQRQRYWLEAPKSRGDIPSLGLSSIEHPILRVAIPLADSEGELFTGRLSLSEQPWLADHKVFDTVLLCGRGSWTWPWRRALPWAVP